MRDLLITRNGKLGLVEHKTTTILDANYLAKLPMDSQILSYAISCKKEKSIGKYPDFIVYNVAKKSQIRLKQTETMEQFAKRLVDEYMMNPSAYFYREILSFSKADFQKLPVNPAFHGDSIDRHHRTETVQVDRDVLFACRHGNHRSGPGAFGIRGVGGDDASDYNQTGNDQNDSDEPDPATLAFS
jgi:hypothetical protein